MEAKGLRIFRATEPTVKKIKAKLKILVKEDIWVDSITKQIV